MKHMTFNKKQLAVAISLLLGSGIAAPSFAQEEEAAAVDVEIIAVRGIRGSFARSMDLKREGSGVVDAISAEEMGKFPDTNLAESLQRITGVSVSRANGEGSQITVRGFGPQFNLITLNGRSMPGTGNSRSYDLANLSSEGVSTLSVYKTARADLPSGGLGATVDIETVKPFNSPGFKFSVSGKAVHDTSNEKGKDFTPEFAAVISNTFLDDRVGVAFSFSEQRRDFQLQQSATAGWLANSTLPANATLAIDPRGADHPNAGTAHLPQDLGYGILDSQRTRTNGQLTLQFAFTDDLIGTIDYTATRVTALTETVGWGSWYGGFGGLTGYELDANGTAIFMNITPDDASYTASRATTDVEADSIGVNLEWAINDDWSVEFDYHDSSNSADNGGDGTIGGTAQLIFGSPNLATSTYDSRTGDLPQILALWENGTNEVTRAEIDHNFGQFLHNPGESTIEQARFDVEWINPNDFPMTTLTFGASITDQLAEGSNAWSGLRGGPGFATSYASAFPDGMFIRQETTDFLDQFDGGGSDLSTNYYYTFDFDEAIARSVANITEAVAGSDNFFDPNPYFDGVDSEGSVQEETAAIYINSLWDLEFGDYYVTINVGGRYEETDVTSLTRQQVAEQVNWESATEWVTQFQAGGDDNFFEDQGEHSAFLPNFDFKLDVTEDMVARLSWGKTMARAPLGNLGGGQSLSGSPKIGARIGSIGNTNLQPFKSTNLDISFEYYYSEGSYASIGYFKKDVENFIANLTEERTFEGLNDVYLGPRYNAAVAALQADGQGTTSTDVFEYFLANGLDNGSGVIEPAADDPLIVWNVTVPQNLEEKSVNGIEVAVQHLFGESGFGLSANATFVDGDVEFDQDSFTTQTPLSGLSDSANLQAFYEKDGLSVKFTYAWRDAYLAGLGQSAGSAGEPTFAASFAQLDMSVNYDVSEELTVFFEGINLNNETVQTYGRYENQFLSAGQFGPRYILGARYSF